MCKFILLKAYYLKHHRVCIYTLDTLDKFIIALDLSRPVDSAPISLKYLT